MYHLEVDDEWNAIHYEDLWIYNKLQLSRELGYKCGPIGSTVPKPDFYIVRPAINFLGMGRFAEIVWIDKSTEHFHPANFWCEVFKGEHLSVDFYHQEAKLVVKGTKDDNDPLYKWQKWEKIDKVMEFPPILKKLKGNYDWINCEFIDGNLIEVHTRQNPNFRYGNTVAIPVWGEENDKKPSDLSYIEDSGYLRKGFYLK